MKGQGRKNAPRARQAAKAEATPSRSIDAAPWLTYQAFDDAWNEIAANYSPDQVEAGRTRLAKVLLSVTTDDMTDAETLKRLALEGMAKPTS